MDSDPSVDLCDASDLLRLLAGAVLRLEQEAAAINALNVFPVPDGDTGTNMLLTIRAALNACVQGGADLNTIAAVAAASARGALIGARGNSGVILSQMLRGVAESVTGRSSIDGMGFVRGLSAAASSAYASVPVPVEGTMLTVIREAAEAAAHLDHPTIDTVLETALAEARRSLSRTPELLAILKQAGVVDAGGKGLVALLEGALLAWREADVSQVNRPVGSTADGKTFPEAAAGLANFAGHDTDFGSASYGYCTEFLVRFPAVDLNVIRQAITNLGDSVLVVGDGDIVRVHVHTFDPGAALSFATGRGSLLQVKVENMQEQHRAFVGAGQVAVQAREAPESMPPGGDGRIDIVAVAAGAGLEKVFQSLGVIVVHGGQTMNPSVADLLEAVNRCRSSNVILLPNNPNVITTARQAAGISPRQVVVIPTRSVPQGIAAVMSHRPEAKTEDVAAAMTKALDEVRTLEVTIAVRPATLDGVDVGLGQSIALLDERLVAVGDSPESVALASVRDVTGFTPALLTVYYGDRVAAPQALALAAELRLILPDAEVEVMAGGQPHYPYIIALEQ